MTMNRQTKNALIIFGVIMLVLFILAAYGYFTGSWLEANPPIVPRDPGG
jgi:hypothetical protein